MSKNRIYIAEDQPLQSELMRAALEGHEEYDCTFFSDGLEMYQTIQDNPPDLIILDIILPSLSGLAVSRLVKFHDYYDKIPILVISSITDPDIKEQALNVGANDFLPKPFEVQELLVRIDRLLKVKAQ